MHSMVVLSFFQHSSYILSWNIVSFEEPWSNSQIAQTLGCRHKFLGILNGLDESLWNPSQDAALPATYTVENLSGKSICKTALQQRLGLPPADYSLPLVSHFF
jgi:glycogen synthase